VKKKETPETVFVGFSFFYGRADYSGKTMKSSKQALENRYSARLNYEFA